MSNDICDHVIGMILCDSTLQEVAHEGGKEAGMVADANN